jgi:hypothetical protein
MRNTISFDRTLKRVCNGALSDEFVEVTRAISPCENRVTHRTSCSETTNQSRCALQKNQSLEFVKRRRSEEAARLSTARIATLMAAAIKP